MRINRACLALGLAGALGATTAIAASTEGAGGQAQKAVPGKGKSWEAFAARFDGNKDGKVSKDELLGTHPGFDRVDADKDGIVTGDEAKAAREAAGKGGQGKKAKKGFLDRFDADKDGRVTVDEFNRGRGKGFEAMDKNKDGVVDRDEFEARVQDAAASRELAESE